MITLIGEKLARKGSRFLFCGPAEECEDCRFRSTCIGPLEEGRLYRITDVKDRYQKCPVHLGEKVRVIEVEKSNVEVLIDAKGAFEGSLISFEPPECDLECSLHDLCFPEGIREGDRCRIVKNLGKPGKQCPGGHELRRVLLKPLNKK
ncbi:UPF0179 family protein [Methanothermobacter sp.]|uniref:UPF0179 family protein n=1 Tax=Methanothermobacter sp. TaxID=1884223 RepID=UPI003C71C03B